LAQGVARESHRTLFHNVEAMGGSSHIIAFSVLLVTALPIGDCLYYKPLKQPSIAATSLCVQQPSCELDFSSGQVERTLRPDVPSQMLRYRHVCSVAGRSTDLVVEVMTPYTVWNSSKDGLKGQFGNINLKSGTNFSAVMKFVDAWTDEPVTVGSTVVSFLDLDVGLLGQVESITVSRFTAVSLSGDTELARYDNKDGSSTFAGTSVAEEENNPDDLGNLTSGQLLRAVSFEFKNCHSIPVTFSVTGKVINAGRNFMFAGKTPLLPTCGLSSPLCTLSSPTSVPVPLVEPNPCEGTVHCSLKFADHAVVNNLSPNVSNPSLRYPKVCTVNGSDYDLLLKNTTTYTPRDYEHDGVYAHFGVLNVLSGTGVGMDFNIVKANSEERVKVPSVIFTIGLVDQGVPGQMFNATIEGFSDVHRPTNSELSQVDNSDGSSTFSVMDSGLQSEIPQDFMALTRKQKARAVSFLFREVSGWHVSFSASAHGSTGKSLLFAGETSIMKSC